MCTFQARLRAIPSVSTSMGTEVEHRWALVKPPDSPLSGKAVRCPGSNFDVQLDPSNDAASVSREVGVAVAYCAVTLQGDDGASAPCPASEHVIGAYPSRELMEVHSRTPRPVFS